MYQKIKITELFNLIVSTFNLDCNYNLEKENMAQLLSPGFLADILNKNGYPNEWIELPYEQVCQPVIENRFSEEVIDDLVMNCIFPQELDLKGEMILMTDRTWIDRVAIMLNFEYFTEFREDIYPELYEMNFVEPEDQVFLFTESKTLVLFHHEGFYVQIKKD